jgi:Na+-translocating ferredoxin:NAD+ oxidoreductase RnfD subunit
MEWMYSPWTWVVVAVVIAGLYLYWNRQRT